MPPTQTAPSHTPPQSTPAPTPEPQDTGAFNWEFEEIDVGTKPSLALNSDGLPHIAYMLEELRGFVKSAVRSGPSEWEITTVQEGYFYGPLDIAIDGNDTPFIAYHDHQDSTFVPSKGDAIVAFQENGGWNPQSIKHPGHDGWDNRIIADSQGNIHMSAIDPVDFGGRSVEYYFRDGSGNWTVEEIGSEPLTYMFATSVAVGPDNKPHITFMDQSGRTGKLALASKNGSGWVISTVDDSGDTGLFSHLIVDQEGRFHVSYLERKGTSSGVVKYATRGPSDPEWGIREVDSLNNLSFGFVGARNITSLALDSNGNPWIAYSDESFIRLAVWDGAEWQVNTVVDSGRKVLGQLVVLKLDSNDEPHLAYFDVTTMQPLRGVVRYAKGTPK
ncbi:MAG: hypothetical protein L0177_01550 [Chloroflexi bacterium]|nr:hypothetical protein [Chloroflexota bacterium]